jgi:AraC family transcriptional regulator of adaptative response/methylated-DNA-[protein]-cysteine methyltransferase
VLNNEEILVGKTVAYAKFARRVGSPKAVRAAVGTCAANNVAVTIPCRRVVRNDGFAPKICLDVERNGILLDREAWQST